MKHLKNIILTAGLTALLGTLTVSAQDLKAVANIPFDYSVGQHSMSAGKYTIAELSTRGMFRLGDNTSSGSMFVITVPQDTQPNSESKLVFNCYAGQCSLSQIWIAGNGYKLTARPLPREAKNQLGVVAMVSVPLLSR